MPATIYIKRDSDGLHVAKRTDPNAEAFEVDEHQAEAIGVVLRAYGYWADFFRERRKEKARAG